MFFAMGDDLSYGLNTLGPLCLWQCFVIISQKARSLLMKSLQKHDDSGWKRINPDKSLREKKMLGPFPFE